MWKIFLIGIVCIALVGGQCDNCDPCYGQKEYPTKTTQRNVAPRNSTQLSHNTGIVTSHTNGSAAPVITPQNTDAAQNLSFFNPAAAAAKRPPSPIIFPQEISEFDTEIPSELFSIKLFEQLSRANTNQNLLFSPISLQVLLSFIYTISEGKLARELANLLDLPQNHSIVAEAFQSFTKTPYTNVNNTLIMANKLYYEQRFGMLQPNVLNLAVHNFASEVEPLDFLATRKAVQMINSWVAEKTRNLIQNIISPSSVTADTRAVLVNTLYFKSEWQQKFSSYDTDKQPFFLNGNQQVSVDMMYIEDSFRFAELDDLKAKVVELPYKLDDFRMLIILPNEIDDLAEVERKVTKVGLKAISNRLNQAEVNIRLPRFKIEFEADMVQTLQQLGLFSLFNDDAHIELFKNQQKSISVDQIKQKAYISVDEAGTEAAAVTFATFVPLSIPLRVKQFTADHPFMFVIRNSKAAYFMGHVANF